MSDTGYLSLQINTICVLLALLGIIAIVQHPAWFGSVSTAREVTASRLK
jgi:hypothetical protein